MDDATRKLITLLNMSISALNANDFSTMQRHAWTMVDQQPHFAEGHHLLALSYHMAGDHQSSFKHFERARALEPTQGEYAANHGAALAADDQLDEAYQALQEALNRDAQHVGALANLARLLLRMERRDEAISYFIMAIRLMPDDAELMGDLAVVLLQCGRLDQSLTLFAQALAMDANNAEIHCNYAMGLLMAGHYAEGWQEQEWRWRSRLYDAVTPRSFAHPVWDGSPLEGKRVLIVSEQGLGDTLQFVRCAPLVREKLGAAFVALSCHGPLVRLFESLRGVDMICESSDFPEDIDYTLPLLSLPLYLGIEIDSIPPPPYLEALPFLAEGIAPDLITMPRDLPRVGVIWQGNNQRALNLEILAPLLDMLEIQWHSLQHGEPAQAAHTAGLPEWGSRVSDFAETAALMQQMDLIISVDTSSAHLAGALGLPLWVMLHPTADWRWGREGDHTPWYPAARLFRSQYGEEGWGSLIDEVAQALRQWLTERNP